MRQKKKQKHPTAGGRRQHQARASSKAGPDLDRALAGAIRCHQAGDLDQAAKLYDKILVIAPQHAETMHAKAILACQRGQHVAAIALFQQAIRKDPAKPAYHFNLGNAFKNLGRFAEAVPCYEEAIRLKPDYYEAMNNLGTVFKGQDRLTEAVAAYEKAVQTKPDYAEALYNLANSLRSLDRLPEAIVCLQQAMAAKENFPEVYNCLGNIFQEQGKPEAAIGCFQHALRLNPKVAEFHFNLATAFTDLGRFNEAIASYQQAVKLVPDFATAHNNLGDIFKNLGRFSEAEASLRRALEVKPDYAEAYNNLGYFLTEQSRLTEAEACLRRALELMPDCAEMHGNLGHTLRGQGRLHEAEACQRRALELKPDYAKAYNNLAVTHMAQGRLTAAEANLRRALELKPDYATAHSNLLFCLTHNETVDAETLFSEHCQFGEQFETPFHANYPQLTNSRNPERALRIGFVSGDLRNHAVAYFIEPVLAHLSNYSQLSLHAYSNHATEDTVTQRIREHCTHWHNIVGLSDASLAEKICADSIDILIDLSGHTAKNRLLTFARKPAPVQASWIGYPGTTGLKAMDYYLADRFRLPHGQFDGQFTEKIVQLPVSAPFSPFEAAPLVNALPAIRNGYLTFGSFNRLNKLSHAVIVLWAQLLRAFPYSRIALGGMAKDEKFDTLVEWFALEGVARERISFHQRTDMDGYLALHHQVDICLSPFPYTGGTTICHALWMGVPSLTLTGNTIPSRGGASILSHVGLEAFIAQDAADFVQKGLAWANDLSALASLRADLRERFAQSAMGQPAIAAAGVEQALRIMWQRWCAGLPAESFAVDLHKMGTEIHEGGKQ